MLWCLLEATAEDSLLSGNKLDNIDCIMTAFIQHGIDLSDFIHLLNECKLIGNDRHGLVIKNMKELMGNLIEKEKKSNHQQIFILHAYKTYLLPSPTQLYISILRIWQVSFKYWNVYIICIHKII